MGNEYLYFIEATDPNGDPLDFVLESGPAGMTIGGNNDPVNLVRWRPTGPQVGPNLMSIRVDDGRGGIVIQDATIEVVTDVSNEPPSIVSTPIFFAAVGETYGYDVKAVDPEGDQLVYSLTVRPIGMSLNELAGTLRWTPTESQLGEHEVVIEVLVWTPLSAMAPRRCLKSSSR